MMEKFAQVSFNINKQKSENEKIEKIKKHFYTRMQSLDPPLKLFKKIQLQLFIKISDDVVTS